MDEAKRQAAVGRAREILDAMGQKNEHQGAKWTIYFNKLWVKEEMDKDQVRADQLKNLRRRKKDYFNYLRQFLNDMVLGCERPGPGYLAGAGMSGDGIYAILTSRWGKTYKRGFKPCGIPAYDILAANTLAGSVEDTMWDLENRKITDSGIYLS